MSKGPPSRRTVAERRRRKFPTHLTPEDFIGPPGTKHAGQDLRLLMIVDPDYVWQVARNAVALKNNMGFAARVLLHGHLLAEAERARKTKLDELERRHRREVENLTRAYEEEKRLCEDLTQYQVLLKYSTYPILDADGNEVDITQLQTSKEADGD